MLKNKTERFLDGELNIEAFQDKESEFSDAYKEVIAQVNDQQHDFNPLKKVESTRKHNLSLTKRILSYAATLLIVISISWMIYKSTPGNKKTTLTEHELAEIQSNTEIALLQFSKELNSCLATFNEAKKISEPTSNNQSFKNIVINKNNPLKNIKLN